MKHFFKIVLIILSFNCYSQSIVDRDELRKTKSETDSVIKFRNEINLLQSQIENMNNAMKKNLTEKQETNLLKDRVITLEKILKNEKKLKNDLFIENYYSAILNLLAIEKDISPLEIYDKTLNFSRSLEYLSNPSNYADYKNWFLQYKEYLKANKSEDIALQFAYDLVVTGKVLTNSVDLGSVSSIIFSSLEKFITSIGKKKNDLRIQSMKMFKLIIVLETFKRESELITVERQKIFEELKMLNVSREMLINEVVKTLPLNKVLLKENYTDQIDLYENIEYLQRVKKQVVDRSNKVDREEVAFQMKKIQNLKIGFANLLLKLQQNMSKYKTFINNYKGDETINVSELDKNYIALETIIIHKYSPERYLNQAITMYNQEY